MKIKIDTEEEKKDVFNKFNSVGSLNQAHKLFGISDNTKGSLYLKEIAKEVGFDINIYKIGKQPIKRYCLQCGKEIINKRAKKFCSKSCSARYNNLNSKKSDETKKKISNTLKLFNTNKRLIENCPDKKEIIQNPKNKHYCKQCGKEINGKQFCSNTCSGIYYHNKSYNDFLINNDKYCRANYSPKPFYIDFLKEQDNKCAICGCLPEHNGKTLRFVIDHIDGDASNNKRENLRLVCPNCDSQLPTFKSKNKYSTRRNYYRWYKPK